MTRDSSHPFAGEITITQDHVRIFQEGSKTYFNSTKFFPEEKRVLVTALYGFVRVADTFVDSIPQDVQGFQQFTQEFRTARENRQLSGNPIIDEFLKLSYQLDFPDTWADAFLYSMELDLTKNTYNTLDETLEYIYGSAEVIGLFMNRVMGIDPKFDHQAQMLGRSMQYINFLRDVHEDHSLGRRYIPLEETDLKGLTEEDYRQDPEEFNRFMRRELERFVSWQKEAETAFPVIPKKLRIPIKTASDMYLWTARKISHNPSVVFHTQVKPPKYRIMLQGILNGLLA